MQRRSTIYDLRPLPKKNLSEKHLAPISSSDDTETSSSSATSAESSYNTPETPKSRYTWAKASMKPSTLRKSAIVTRKAHYAPLFNETIVLGNDTVPEEEIEG